MCGIAGVIRFNGEPVDTSLLRAMADRLAHRGPDGEGYLSRRSVGLAHRRLAIIDLAGFPQPMTSPDCSLHVCSNGEIFNYRELRDEVPFPYRTAATPRCCCPRTPHPGMTASAGSAASSPTRSSTRRSRRSRPLGTASVRSRSISTRADADSCSRRRSRPSSPRCRAACPWTRPASTTT